MTYPLSYEDYLKANKEIKQIEKEVTKAIVDCYEPESTRWRRNYTDRAEWYFLWNYKK